MSKDESKQMKDAELASMLKSNIQFKSLDGVVCESLRLPEEDKKWWRDAKLGLFIHWGLYSILGRGEWVRFNEKIPKEEYESLADSFIPEDFSPAEWVDIAKDLGARYMVMVTRHHDGFALWDSPGSYEQFTSCARGSHRDFVKEYTDACKKAGLNAGLYYSPMDWRFPGYFDPRGQSENAALMKKQCYEQVEELCSSYQPDILWYDGSWLSHQGSDADAAWFWEPIKLNQMVRRYCPKTLISPRSGWEGDFQTDEGDHEIRGGIIPILWEKCMCICTGYAWGWTPNNPPKALDDLIKMLVNVVCRGGNLLLNIGPDKNGKIPENVHKRIREVGKWLETYGESIYETCAGPFDPANDVYGSTQKGDTVYLHILDRQAFASCLLPFPEKKIESAALLHGENISFSLTEGGVRIDLPKDLPAMPDTIVELHMRTA